MTVALIVVSTVLAGVSVIAAVQRAHVVSMRRHVDDMSRQLRLLTDIERERRGVVEALLDPDGPELPLDDENVDISEDVMSTFIDIARRFDTE